ncbi:AAA family ATPase [Actinoplanes sp. HUAS TT8]|uniref:helix-turn-helix transcriptional regulator n=1 Tax=Actinoplanes sp. HUAS TT8 TaxID=3447453 RepID=UPI003F52466A
MLRGRDRELATLSALTGAVRDGRSGALVLTGEAGVGKTALLDATVAAAQGLRVLRVTGVESEMELPYAALHQLCGPLLAHLDRLPGPQRAALRITFGLDAGPAPDAFLVALATLTLLAEAATDRPLLGVVDDAQWLDRASVQALAFVARRLVAESVVMIFGVRGPVDTLRSLPELVIGGLPDTDARALLASAVPWPLDEGVREAILAEAHGNPLALLELPRGLSPAALAGGFGLPGALPGLSRRVEQSFLRRVDGLSPDARRLLLLAAADPVGDATRLWAAARRLGLGPDAGDELEAAGLLRIGLRVVFRHTLVRSAAYRAAPAGERRRVHAALAEATDPATDPDRRAWHRAYAQEVFDERVAAELESSADRAQARGGIAAAAAFLERAAELTGDPARRAGRELAAARAKYQAGAPDAAARLLSRAADGPPDELREARIGLLQGQMAFASPRSAEAPDLLLATARRFEHLDPALARETYLEAFAAAASAGRFAPDAIGRIARAVRDLPPPDAPSGPDLLLDALAVLYTDGFPAGAPLVRAALTAIVRDHPGLDEAVHWLFVADHAAGSISDDQALHVLTARYLTLVREAGALVRLSYIGAHRVTVLLYEGAIAQAAGVAEEMHTGGLATGLARPPFGRMLAAAWQGRAAVADPLIDQIVTVATAQRLGTGLTAAYTARALLRNAHGDHAAARTAAELATANPAETGIANVALAELVEAAMLGGDPVAARSALERLTERSIPSGTGWALGVEAYCRALVTGDEDLFRRAIDHLATSRAAFFLAKAHLLYGEWRCHRGRPDDTHLRTAHEMFTRFGAEGFTARAERALVAAGAAPGPAPTPATVEFTVREHEIAVRARDGRSNVEIGAELFLSTRTVEWHLGKIFAKLGISSRRDLPQQVF